MNNTQYSRKQLIDLYNYKIQETTNRLQYIENLVTTTKKYAQYFENN